MTTTADAAAKAAANCIKDSTFFGNFVHSYIASPTHNLFFKNAAGDWIKTNVTDHIPEFATNFVKEVVPVATGVFSGIKFVNTYDYATAAEKDRNYKKAILEGAQGTLAVIGVTVLLNSEHATALTIGSTIATALTATLYKLKGKEVNKTIVDTKKPVQEIVTEDKTGEKKLTKAQKKAEKTKQDTDAAGGDAGKDLDLTGSKTPKDLTGSKTSTDETKEKND